MQVFKDMDALDVWANRHISQKVCNQQNFIAVVKFNIKNGIDLKENGSSHLLTACRFKKIIIVDFLITAGAVVDFRNAEGQTPLTYALQGFYARKDEDKLKLVDKLIQQGASLSLQDDLGRSLLHQWAFDAPVERYKCYNIGILSHLLSNNVPVDLVDNKGNTALMHAAAHSSGRVMMFLEATKEPPPAYREFVLDQQNFAGDTCAHLIVMRTKDQTLEQYVRDDRYQGCAFKMLISRGVSLYIPNNNGKTVIDCALECRVGDDTVREVLYTHTKECMLAFLMGAHVRLGRTSVVKHLDDIAVELVLSETQKLIQSILLNSVDDWWRMT